MLDLLGYILFVFAGLFFGLFGSGGSIIIIPILIYIFKVSIYEATTYSLLLVFLISLIGTIKHMKKQNLKIQGILIFIIPTIIFTVISRVFLFPAIPDYIEIFNSTKESLLMMLFSGVILLSSLSLLRSKPIVTKSNFQVILLSIGVLVGLLTGLLGIGGGFIILPALVLFTGMNMRQAASSTLFIIMLNTFMAIIVEFTVFQFQFHIGFVLLLLLSALIGTFIGVYLLDKLDQNIIKKLFSIALLFLSLVIFLVELI
tara:strand:- start:269 stop:1042 length:774 start_codon:yes stop_codon:yes gene_type:complete